VPKLILVGFFWLGQKKEGGELIPTPNVKFNKNSQNVVEP
jgi:hypothetical protein